MDMDSGNESGKEVDGLTGFVLAWGKPDDNSRYYYGHNNANFVVRTRNIEESTVTYKEDLWNYKVRINEQTTCRSTTSSYYQYDSNVQRFQELVVKDRINNLIMTTIPESKSCLLNIHEIRKVGGSSTEAEMSTKVIPILFSYRM